MNKMNKKGFTLIEMLVVIAIIAILVAIIIPTVQSATDKAAAATNAANLRSVKAEVTTNYLMTGSVGDYTRVKSKAVGDYCGKNVDVSVGQPDGKGNIKVTFNNVDIDTFSKIASGDLSPKKAG